MASKRKSKIVKNKPINYNNLSLENVICSICQGILIEPTTLPCTHSFCSSCFANSTEKTNLVCPLCRTRIGSWLRTVKRNKTYINEPYWKAINMLFPNVVKNKLNNVDVNIEAKPRVQISQPGEIREEFNKQVQKEMEITRKQNEINMKASEELVRQIMEEEKIELSSNDKTKNNLAKNTPSTSNSKCRPLDSFLKKIPSKENSPTSKEFVCRILYLDKKPQNGNSASLRKKHDPIKKVLESNLCRDSSDSIESECRHFKPIDHRLNSPSNYKSPLKIPCRKLRAKQASRFNAPNGLVNFTSHTHQSAFARLDLNTPCDKNFESSDLCTEKSMSPRNKTILNSSRTLKRKNTEDITTNCDNSKTKRHLFSDRNMLSKDLSKNNNIKYLKYNNSVTNDTLSNNESLTDYMKFNQEKLLQEKSDFEFALKLQKEFNKASLSTRRRTRSLKGQLTLDEIITNTYKVK